MSLSQPVQYMSAPPSDWCLGGDAAGLAASAGQPCAYGVMRPASDSSSPPQTAGAPGNVDDGLTSLSWLQNLNMCMTRLGAPTPPTPPASPNSSGLVGGQHPSHPHSNLHQHSSGARGTHANGFSSAFPGHASSLNASQANSSLHQPHPPTAREGRSKKANPPAAPVEEVDYKTNGTVKPPYSYATLICMAMKANKNKMTLNSIYKWIRENFLYYQKADPSWQNSIRHNLSLNKCFIKIPRTKEEPGKGGFWRLDPVYAETLVDGVFKKRRPSHRSGAPNAANGTFRKKSRKKEKTEPIDSKKGILTINQSSSQTQNGAIVHETPPSSAESYNGYMETAPENAEIVTAVHSIEGQLGPHPCAIAHQYTPFVGQPAHELVSGYGDEVCVSSGHPEGLVLGSETGEICWNAILTDADLELVDPTNYAGQVVHTSVTDAGNVGCTNSTTTTQLMAVEPHGLHLSVEHAGHGVMMEEGDMYGSGVESGSAVTTLVRVPVSSADIISANNNVVTCINQSAHTAQGWAGWSHYTTTNAHAEQVTLTMQNTIHRLSSPQIQLGHHSVPMDMAPHDMKTSGVVYLHGQRRDSSTSNPSPASCQHISSHRSSTNAGPPSSGSHSPHSSHSFDSHSSLQPWVECKAALEAAALDLEHFTDLESVHSY